MRGDSGSASGAKRAPSLGSGLVFCAASIRFPCRRSFIATSETFCGDCKCYAPEAASLRLAIWLLKNRMSELFTSGSVGGAVGNRRSYPAADLAFGLEFSNVYSSGSRYIMRA
jgi:hypothetical protein